MRISHEASNLTLTAEHMVFVAVGDDKEEAIPAAQVHPGTKLLIMVNGERFQSAVSGVEDVVMEGYYAPITASTTSWRPATHRTNASLSRIPSSTRPCSHCVWRLTGWLMPLKKECYIPMQSSGKP